ncbi:MAG: DUF6326 family protein [Actinomycetales bacterium]
MRATPAAPLVDNPTDPKLMLSALWVAMLFVFAYVDIFGFFRADVLEGALAGTVSGPGFTIDQTFLTLTTGYIVVPILMVVASLILPARAARPANLVVAVVYAVSIVVSMIGESWVYYLAGSAVELVFLAGVIGVAARWPRVGSRDELPARDEGAIYR